MKRQLIETYNVGGHLIWACLFQEASCKTHLQSNFFKTSTQTDLDKDPWEFDVADVADTVLMFGGLGPILLGEYWETESM
jgi:hypothetical protein